MVTGQAATAAGALRQGKQASGQQALLLLLKRATPTHLPIDPIAKIPAAVRCVLAAGCARRRWRPWATWLLRLRTARGCRGASA